MKKENEKQALEPDPNSPSEPDPLYSTDPNAKSHAPWVFADTPDHFIAFVEQAKHTIGGLQFWEADKAIKNVLADAYSKAVSLARKVRLPEPSKPPENVANLSECETYLDALCSWATRAIPKDVPTWQLTYPWLVPPTGSDDLVTWLGKQLELKDEIRRARESHGLNAKPMPLQHYSLGADAVIDVASRLGIKSAVYPGAVPPEITWDELQAVYRDLLATMTASTSNMPPVPPAKRKRTGAPIQYDRAADRRLAMNWQAAKVNGSTMVEFARNRGQAVDEVKAAVERDRKRRNKSAE